MSFAAVARGRLVGSILWPHAKGAKVDADATCAYLETDRPELERYYRGAGFEVRERIQVFGVPVLLMERPARSASLR